MTRKCLCTAYFKYGAQVRYNKRNAKNISDCKRKYIDAKENEHVSLHGERGRKQSDKS
jgi:hypothetical protein